MVKRGYKELHCREVPAQYAQSLTHCRADVRLAAGSRSGARFYVQDASALSTTPARR
jgi:hypothetical protein